VTQKTPSPQEIAAAVTAKGGWTRAQLAAWGVPWPPPSGWKRELEDRYAAERGIPVRRAKIRVARQAAQSTAPMAAHNDNKRGE
jgi:hypothetical protein